MTVNVTYAASISGGGLAIQSSVIRSGSASISLAETLPAAKTGTLSTRTNDTTGTLTMVAGHGLTTGAIIDLYWAGGNRYGVVVGTVATNSVPISGGDGDNLPIATTAITAVVQQNVNIFIDGDETKIIAFALRTNDPLSRVPGHISLFDAEDDLIAEIDLVANVPTILDLVSNISNNPLTGDPITYLRVSTGGSSSTENYQLVIIGVYDASP
jgi:hypothetical protein